MVVRGLMARVQRWQVLGRYYANKWHYDGAKWAERVWYGERATTAAASVPFMITRSMRAQLEAAGFPPHAVAALSPQAAHQVLADKLSYAAFVARQQQEQEKEIADAAARAAAAIAREEEEEETQQAAAPAATALAVVAEGAEAAEAPAAPQAEKKEA